MRDTRERVESDGIFTRVLAEQLAGTIAQFGVAHEIGRKRFDGALRGLEQQPNLAITLTIALRATAFASSLDFFESMFQRCNQLLAALRIVEEIIFEIRIALHCPDVAKHFVQHSRRTTGSTFGTQFVE